MVRCKHRRARRRGRRSLVAPTSSARGQAEAELASLRLLQRLSVEMTREEDIGVLYQKILDAAVRVMRSDFASMQMLDPAREGTLMLLAHRGFCARAAAFWKCTSVVSSTSCGAALRAGRRVVIPDVEACDRVAGSADLEVCRAAGIRAMQSTPLVSRTGALVGMLSTHWRRAHEPSERDLRVLDILVRQAADLIAQMRAREALRHRSEQFETLLNRAPLAVFLVGSDLCIREVNPIARAFFGEIPGGVVGKGLAELVHVWEQEHADDLVRTFRRTLETGEPHVQAECVQWRADRKILEQYEWRVDRITLPDGQHGLVCYFRDISEAVAARDALTASEERFRTLADVIPQLVVVHDPEGKVELVNRRWREYTGLAAAGLADLPAVVHAEDLDRMTAGWKEALASGQPFATEVRLRRAWDGAYRWFLWRAVPIRDARGDVARWFGTSTDIDDQKRMEQALREQDRRKDEFLATLAHELRNPLAPVRTGLSVLKRAPGEDTRARALDMMDRQIAHMVRLIDDLMDVSRLSRGKVELRRERVDVRAIVEAAVEVSRPLVDAGRHTLSVSLRGEQLLLDADPTRMAQVVSNLLNNAAKYTPEGGRIELGAEREGARVVLRVRDNGTGIPREMLPRVFDLFEQVGRSLDRAQGGLGIGLSLVRKLVEMHGGTVTGESPGLGRGSTFTLRLPLAAPAEADGPGAPAHEPQGRAPCLRVLVVDDNVDGAESLSLFLSMNGHETAVAHSGPEAVEAARRFRPDVVFLDIGLPGMNGYEVAKALRREGPARSALLVALTGWGADEDKQQAMDAGIDVHLIKPASLGAVEQILARACTRGAAAC